MEIPILHKHSVTRLRWPMLLFFCLASAGNSFAWITFSPISTLFNDRFHFTSNQGVDMLSMVYMICYLPGSVIISWVVNRWGLRAGLVLGSVLTCGGGWVRYVGRDDYNILLGGQILCAMGQPVVLNSVAMFSSLWFATHERPFATSICFMANNIGIGVGFLVPPSLMRTPDELPRLLLVEAIIISACVLPSLLLFRSRPTVPPSRSSMKQVLLAKEQDISTKDMVKSLACNGSFITVLLILSIVVGVFTSFATVVNQLLHPFGYNEKFSGMVGTVSTLTGALGTPLSGWLLSSCSPPRYKLMMLLSLFPAAACYGALALALRPHSSYTVFVLVIVASSVCSPTMSTCFELSAEVTYPFPEDIPGGAMMVCSQLAGIVLTQLAAFLLTTGTLQQGAQRCLWLYCGCIMFCFVLALFLRATLQRHAVDSAKSRPNSRSASRTPSPTRTRETQEGGQWVTPPTRTLVNPVGEA